VGRRERETSKKKKSEKKARVASRDERKPG
jgi:hypothetical protein